MSRAALGHGWSRRKRRARSTEPPSDAEIISEQQAELEELRGRFATLMSPLDIKCEGIYDMDKESDSMDTAGNFREDNAGGETQTVEYFELSDGRDAVDVIARASTRRAWCCGDGA